MDTGEVISRYNHTLSDYVGDVNQTAPAYIARGRTTYGAVLGGAWSYYVFMNFALDQMDQSAGPIEPMSLFIKVAAGLLGLHACLSGGAIESAFTLVRSVFESEITIALLTERDVEDRSKLYREYEHVGRWLNMESIRELVSEHILSQSEFDSRFPTNTVRDNNDAYIRVKTNYHPTRPYHWAWSLMSGTTPNNPSLKQICKHLKRLEDYNRLYGLTSVSAHSSPRSHRMTSSENGVITAAPLFDWRTEALLVGALKYCHNALTHLGFYLAQPARDELIFYSEHRLAQIAEQYLAKQP